MCSKWSLFDLLLSQTPCFCLTTYVVDKFLNVFWEPQKDLGAWETAPFLWKHEKLYSDPRTHTNSQAYHTDHQFHPLRTGIKDMKHNSQPTFLYFFLNLVSFSRKSAYFKYWTKISLNNNNKRNRTNEMVQFHPDPLSLFPGIGIVQSRKSTLQFTRWPPNVFPDMQTPSYMHTK